MIWQVPNPPHRPTSEVSLAGVANALVTPFQRGPLRTEPGGPRRWMTGAVHDATGDLVLQSQRTWNGDLNAPLSADPRSVPVPEECRTLSGRWIYAGHWTHHFGHFLVEVLTNLWPDPAQANVIGILAHRSYRGAIRFGRSGGLISAEPTQWQRDLLALAGYGGLKVRIVRERPVRVDHLVVPSRPVLLKSWVQEPAVAVWQRVADAAGEISANRGPKVFMSRAHYHASMVEHPAKLRTSPEWEQLVEARFVEAGYGLVHPEELPVSEQIATVKAAEVVAGLSGSALHLSAFAPRRTRVVELGDERSPTRPMPAQSMIDAALGHEVAFVRHRDVDALDELLGEAWS